MMRVDGGIVFLMFTLRCWVRVVVTRGAKGEGPYWSCGFVCCMLWYREPAPERLITASVFFTALRLLTVFRF
jgi:hypothetical protein